MLRNHRIFDERAIAGEFTPAIVGKWKPRNFSIRSTFSVECRYVFYSKFFQLTRIKLSHYMVSTKREMHFRIPNHHCGLGSPHFSLGRLAFHLVYRHQKQVANTSVRWTGVGIPHSGLVLTQGFLFADRVPCSGFLPHQRFEISRTAKFVRWLSSCHFQAN